MDAKPGYKTTEFWMSVLTLVAGIALILTGEKEPGMMLLGASGVQGMHYAQNRTELKRK